jgi:cytoskeleton protein RodZ
MDMMDGSGTSETNRAAGGGLAEIGAMLRRRREEVGQELAAISAATNIRAHYLRAIEEGRRKDLPGTAYLIGYLRTYANHLGFDGNRLITDYHDALAGHRQRADKRAEPAQPSGIRLPDLQVSPVILMAGLLVLGVVGYVAWGYATAPKEGGTELATVAKAPVEPITPDEVPVVAPAAKPATPSPTGANASTSANPTQPSAEGPGEAASATAAVPATGAGEAPAAAEDQVPPEADIATLAEEEPAEEPSSHQQAVAAEPESEPGKIVIRARLESWVQITDAEREVIFSRVMRAGETYTVLEEAQGLMFTTGNAGGVEILVDGTKLKSLGAVGLVKRDIPLDPAKLKDGSAFRTSRAGN